MKTIIAVLSHNPNVIKKALGFKGKIQETGITLMGGSTHMEFGYNRDLGEIQVILNSNDVSGGLTELRIWMKAKNLPTSYKGESLIELNKIEDGKLVKLDNSVWEYL